MKYAIVFSSQTGNTKQLAEAVSSVLPQADLCFFGSPSQEALQAERLFIGFWTDKGRCNQEITDFHRHLHVPGENAAIGAGALCKDEKQPSADPKR